MDERRIELTTSDGTRLVGRLAIPPKPSLGAVLCHPHPLYGGTMENLLVTRSATALQEAGVATVRFNFRGAGGSSGTHDRGTGELLDVAAALDALHDAMPAGVPLAITGYSFGSWVGLRAGTEDARVARMVGIAPPVSMAPFSFLARSRIPVLLIVGERDELGSPAQVRDAVGADNQAVRLEVIPGADHFFPGRSPEVARYVARFLAGPLPGPA